MARPIWSGSLAFGLVNIPVGIYSAVGEGGLSFRFLHKKDLSPINYAKVCREDGTEVPFDDVVKGYEYRKGDFVVLTEADFKKANIKKTSTISVTDFVAEAEIDPIYYETPYYLAPEEGAEKAYAILRESLKRTKKVGVAKFVLRSKEYLGVIKPEGNALMLIELRYKSEIRKPSGLNIPGEKETTSREVEMAIKLIDQFTDHFKPEKYKDTYKADLKQIIGKKIAGKVVHPRGKKPAPTRNVDLMKKLKASLEKSMR